MNPDPRDGLVFEADKTKPVSALRKTAKAAGGGGKGGWGCLSLNGKVLVLECEDEPHSKLATLLRRHFSDRGQSVQVEIRGKNAALPDNEAPDGEVAPEPMFQAERDVSAESEEDTFPDDPDDPDDEDDAAAHAGDLKKLLTAAKKKDFNFAWLLGGEDLVLKAHRRKPTDALVKAAVREGSTKRGACGTMRVEGKTVILSCENKPPKSFGRSARDFLRSRGEKRKVIVRGPDGVTVSEDEIEDDQAQDVQQSEPDVTEADEVGSAPEADASKSPLELLAEAHATLSPHIDAAMAGDARVAAQVARLSEKFLNGIEQGKEGMARQLLDMLQAELKKVPVPDAIAAKPVASEPAVEALEEDMPSGETSAADAAPAVSPESVDTAASDAPSETTEKTPIEALADSHAELGRWISAAQAGDERVAKQVTWLSEKFLINIEQGKEGMARQVLDMLHAELQKVPEPESVAADDPESDEPLAEAADEDDELDSEVIVGEVTMNVHSAAADLAAAAEQSDAPEQVDAKPPEKKRFVQYRLQVAPFMVGMDDKEVVVEIVKQFYSMSQAAAEAKVEREKIYLSKNDFVVTKDHLDEGSITVLVQVLGQNPVTMKDVRRGREEFEQVPEEVKGQINSRTDTLFYQQSGFDVGEKIDKDDPTFVAWSQRWLAMRAEVMDDQRVRAQLSGKLAKLLGDGRTGPPLKEEDIPALLALEGHLEFLTDEQIADYVKRTNQQGAGVKSLLDSVKEYIDRVKEREDASQARRGAQDNLVGLDDLYKIWRKANPTEAMNSRAVELAFSLGSTLKEREKGQAMLKGFEQAKLALPAALAAEGYKSENEFEKDIKTFRKAFEADAIEIANEAMERTEHLLWDYQERMPGNKAFEKMAGALQGFIDRNQDILVDRNVPGSEENENFGSLLSSKDSNAAIADELRPFLEQAMAADPQLKEMFAALHVGRRGEPLDASFMLQLMSRCSVPDTDRGLSGRKFDGRLLRGFVSEQLEDRRDSMGVARGAIYGDKDPNPIWDFDGALLVARNEALIGKEGIAASIIDDHKEKLAQEESDKALWMGLLTGLTVVLSFGTGTLALAGAFGGALLGTYDAVETAADYRRDNAAYMAGLSSVEPSFGWVVAALTFGAGDVVDVGARLAKPALKLSQLDELVKKGTQTGDAIAEFSENLPKIAEPGSAEAYVEILRKSLEGAENISAEQAALLVARARKEADSAVAFASANAARFAENGGKIDLANISEGELAEVIAAPVVIALHNKTGGLERFLNSPAGISLLGEGIVKNRETLQKVKAAYAEAAKVHQSLKRTALTRNMSEADFGTALEKWLSHPELTSKQFSDELLQKPIALGAAGASDAGARQGLDGLTDSEVDDFIWQIDSHVDEARQIAEGVHEVRPMAHKSTLWRDVFEAKFETLSSSQKTMLGQMLGTRLDFDVEKMLDKLKAVDPEAYRRIPPPLPGPDDVPLPRNNMSDVWDDAVASSKVTPENMAEVRRKLAQAEVLEHAGDLPGSEVLRKEAVKLAGDTYSNLQQAFWKRLHKPENEHLLVLFESTGLTVDKGVAPYFKTVNPEDATKEIRDMVTLDHFMRKSLFPERAVDSTNLVTSMKHENSWMLEPIRDTLEEIAETVSPR